MNCEEANSLISARIDGELPGDGQAALDAHLAECETCRVSLAEMELQDAALLRAFLPRRDSALAVASRVAQAVAQDPQTARPAPVGRFTPRLHRWAGWAAAAAAGFIAAIVIVKLGQPRTPPVQISTQANPMPRVVAHLAIATGDVLIRPADQYQWRPLSRFDVISVGATVRTTDTSKCELQLAGAGSCIRLNSMTEVRFTGDRAVQLSCGQLSSEVSNDDSPLRVISGLTAVSATGAESERGTQFDLACKANAAVVTVQCGLVDVTGNGPHTKVHGGQVLNPAGETGVYACAAALDPLMAARWQDDLLVLKSGDDREVIARVSELLARISLDRSRADVPDEAEHDVRARGAAWCSGIACYMRYHPKESEQATRRIAARLLADLAPPASVPDLIDLLADDDGNVRHDAAMALRRLTGQSLGHPPEACAAGRDPAAIVAWRQWWEQNKVRQMAGK